MEETLGYEGAFTAVDGSAAGLVLADIKQFEAPSTAVGHSLQLQGSGTSATDFTWSEPIGATPDEVNNGQNFEASPTAAPLNTQAPGISGAGNVGETQFCSTGSWEGSPDAYSYEWSVDGTPLGVSSDSYTLEGWPSGSTLSCTVTASNAAGSASAESTAVEVTAAPVSAEAPSISGDGNVGEAQHCSTGSWEGNPSSYGYEWSVNGSPIGVYTDSLTLESWPSGSTFTCTVSASNSAGSASAESAPVEVRTPPAAQTPASIEAPSISGIPTLEETLSCSPGAWENGPTAYAYQWTRDSAPILEASSAGYAVQQVDQGHLLVCTVTASNSAGPASAASAPVAVQAATHSPLGAGGDGLSSRPPAPPRTFEPSAPVPPPTFEPFAPLSEVGPSAASIVDSLAALLSTGWSPPMVRHLSWHGAHSIWFSAPSAGTIRVQWAAAGTRAAATLAQGDSRFLSGVRGRLKLRLTAAGRKRLGRRQSLLVTEIATFTPNIGSAQTMQAQISIRRR